ncbi:MotA/TolQ/ExbB proton channel family protein [Cryomorphaceae bacterium]|nr:MotA/TolQ/ExbB proton channel family protein [Cryomorphaceae bacterium]
MLELFYQGGALFMGLLTLIFIAMISVTVVQVLRITRGQVSGLENISRQLTYTRSIGLFAFIVGLLGQLIGLFSAFKAIELKLVDVSPALLAGGFKVSMIPTMYGLIIYVIALALWLGLSAWLQKD